MPSPHDLPMVITGCGLDAAELRAQAERYRVLGTAVTDVRRDGDERLLVSFSPGVDLELLRAAIATEAACCPFLALRYDAALRRLSITASDARGRSVLSALGVALSPAG